VIRRPLTNHFLLHHTAPHRTNLYSSQPTGQIRTGGGNEHRGKAFVVYEDLYDAKAALEHLNGFNVCGRYLVSKGCWPASVSACLPAGLPACLPACLRACLPACLPPCLPASHHIAPR